MKSAKQADGYPTLSAYLDVDELQVYHLENEGDEMSTITMVPKMTTCYSDTTNVIIEMSYPMVSSISDYRQSGENIQFNGTDIVISPQQLNMERLYVPMDIIVHINGEVIETTPHKVFVEYGQTKIQYVIPCAQLAQTAIVEAAEMYDAFMSKGKPTIHLSNWSFDFGELHVYAEVNDAIETTAYVNGTATPVSVQMFLSEGDRTTYKLTMPEELADELRERLAPSEKYHATSEVKTENGIDTLHITRTIATENFPENYNELKPFIDYLSGFGYYVDDEMVYDYYEQQKKLKKGNYGTR